MNVVRPTRETIVEFIADIFRRRGAAAYLGEAVTMSQHMLQAALRAETDGASDAMIAAALLHDIGHFTGEFPEDALARGIDNRHESAGGHVLAPFFPPAMTEPVRLHVLAKRYLCAVDPAYVERLSEASIHTLKLQGGPMSVGEAAAFAAGGYHEAAIAVRLWDDAAKVVGGETPPFAHYAPLLRTLAAAGDGAP